MGVQIIYKDFGLDEMLKRVDDIAKDQPYLKVGFLEENGARRPKVSASHNSFRASGTPTNPELAVIQEYGSGDGVVPARPFFRPMLNEQHRNIRDGFQWILGDQLLGTRRFSQGLRFLGKTLVKELQAKIRSNIQPANTAATLRHKKGSKTLLDTRQLVNAVGLEVNGGTKNMITPLDLSWLVDEFSSYAIMISRPAEGYSAAGLRTSTLTSLTAKGSVQPITGDELRRLPEGFQDKNLVSVWSKTAMFLRDRLTINGQKYEVQHVDDWVGDGTYFKVIAQQLDIRETL